MTIRVYNTLSDKKEEFIPKEEGKIGMYVCGPTVYNYIHIGNARCYLSFDIIKRYLKFKGFTVYHVQNFTDVDDKIINRAKEENTSPEEIAEKYTDAFREDMKKLKVASPDVAPKATETISDMIEVIKVLIEKGFAYQIEGSVYFEVTKFKGYGKLSKRTLEDMRAGERVEVDERKRHPMDFALWKEAKEVEPYWESPWGKGRPGWHIECSVMSYKYLGMGFDIHGGGRDLIFPHHENEIAQSESYAGTEPFVRYWLHNGFVNMGEEKMAKSLGNVVLMKDLLEEYPSDVIRMFMLSTHYRSPISFSVERLKESSVKLDTLNKLSSNINFVLANADFNEKDSRIQGFKDSRLKENISRLRQKFIDEMDDDFNTAGALGAIFELEKEINIFINENEPSSPTAKGGQRGVKKQLEEARDTVLELTGVVGLDLGEAKSQSHKVTKSQVNDLEKDLGFSSVSDSESMDSRIDRIVKLRDQMRKEKNWSKADEIRQKLGEIGIVIEDTPYGGRWVHNKT
ncbi:MAG: cysteine--tRNA ligase [Actinobacteria bacterium]|nr:cysteine--tRNA ligase [Actinomycetota bacterium]